MTQRVCAIDGCDRPASSRGWCGAHYERWRKYGDPTATRAPTRGLTVEQRLALNVDRSGGPDACWPWTSKTRHVFGYGQLWDRDLGRGDGAHRVAWRLANGPIPKGKSVLHRCDNPPCCNPAHLYVGTQTDNMADLDARGRRSQVRARGSRNGASKLTEAEVRQIRRLRAEGIGPTELGRRFGVTRRMIRLIANRELWTHVD